jgi:hypothetical protein
MNFKVCPRLLSSLGWGVRSSGGPHKRDTERGSHHGAFGVPYFRKSPTGWGIQ